jgi:cytidyltransferase-like protein
MGQTHKYNHGMLVMRCQPFHLGHQRLIDQALKECTLVTVLLGSMQKRDDRNRWSYHQRKQMLLNVYPDTISKLGILHIFGICDIGDSGHWGTHCLEYIKNCYEIDLNMKGVPEVDAVYAGCKHDIKWYEDDVRNKIIVDRCDSGHNHMSGTMIRELIMLGDDRWKLYVSRANHEFIEKTSRRINFKGSLYE